jgi:hypothetical protein
MKRLLLPAFSLIFAASGLYAQAVNTTVCEVLKNPRAFDGKIVAIKGTVVAGFDQFVINDGNCGKEISGIWLAYPQGTKAKSGPAVMLELSPAHNFAGAAAAAARTPVTLAKDKPFKQFDSALAQIDTSGGICMGCVKNEVQATLTGRLDAVESAAVKSDGSGKIVGLGGFGNMNAYPARLVIASVADVVIKPAGFGLPGQPGQNPPEPKQANLGVGGLSSTDNGSAVAIKNIESGIVPNGSGQGAQPTQPAGPDSYSEQLATLQKIAAAMAPIPITIQIQKDVALLPKPKEHSSIVIGNGVTGEVAANEGAPAALDSPDGVIYTCTINHDKLSGTAAMLTLVHVAQQISDVRAAAAGNRQAPLLGMEHNAWLVSVTTAATYGVKTMALQGGYLIWNAGWPDADKSDNLQTALDKYLSNEEGLKP